jgi:hypothetical protein
MTSLLNFLKYLPIGSDVPGRGAADTHKQKGGLISLRFSFRKESRLKKQAEASLPLEGLRKTTKILIQDTQFPGRDLNPVLSKNEGVLNNPTTIFGE